MRKKVVRQSSDIAFAVNRGLVSILFLVCVLCGDSSAQDFKTVHPGVEHSKVDYKLGNDPVKINLLRLDLTKVRLDVHRALDAAIGTETTSSIATRRGAVAAINAGFFRLDRSAFLGEPAGVILIDGELWSEAERGRIALRLINKKKTTEVFFDHLDSQAWFAFGESNLQIKLSGVNRERKKDEFIVYSRAFGRTTPVTEMGTNVVLGKCARVVKKKIFSIMCSEMSIVENSVSSAIPNSGYVISLGPEKQIKTQMLLTDLRLYLSSGAKRLTFRFRVEDKLLGQAYSPVETEDAVAGVPQLIKNGNIDITWEQEKASKSFVETRHPRTAVAKLKDGRFLMITVDGRQPGVSVGMNLYELSDYILSLGATDAMNLDGGGSTTMFLDGKVVNTTSDKEGERKVSDVILVSLRKRARR